MTLQQIIELIGTNPKTILTYYLIIVALAVVLALTKKIFRGSLANFGMLYFQRSTEEIIKF